MVVLHHGFIRATVLLLSTILQAENAWARSLPAHAPAAPPTLAKRQATDAYYRECYDKGLTLTCASEMSDSMAYIYFNSRSVIAAALTQAQLTASGWTTDADPKNVVVNWVHSVAIDATHPATEANYQCWYNVPAGALIVDLAWSPSYRITLMSDDEWPAGSQLPAIRQLSDVMWIEWAAQAAASGVDAGSLKYIFQMNVVNMDTRAVIERAMGGVPASEWVGYTDFETTSEAGYALLGTPNGNAQAWTSSTTRIRRVPTRAIRMRSLD